LKHIFAEASNSSLHDEVAQHLFHVSGTAGHGSRIVGSQQADHYTHTHIYCFHAKKLCEVFDQTPSRQDFSRWARQDFSFSSFMRKVRPEMCDLKPLNGTNPPTPPFCLELRHPAPLILHPIPQHYFYIDLAVYFFCLHTHARTQFPYSSHASQLILKKSLHVWSSSPM